jgi:hypothetical protein
MAADDDIVPRQPHERIPPQTKGVANSVESATIDPELVRRFMEFRRTYLALEGYMRRQGLDLKSE